MSDDQAGPGGAPANNNNAVKHGLFRDPQKLRTNLDPHEERLLMDIVTDLLDRFPEDAEVGAYERASIENIALDTVKRIKANQYIVENDMIDGSENSDRINRVYSRIMRDTTDELEKLGLLKEGPAMKEAEASHPDAWMSALSEASDDTGPDE